MGDLPVHLFGHRVQVFLPVLGLVGVLEGSSARNDRIEIDSGSRVEAAPD